MFCPKCDSKRLVVLPYLADVFICPDCCTRHIYDEREGVFYRDFVGEEQWRKMASYEKVNKTYEEAFQKEYEYALAQGQKNKKFAQIRK